MRAQPLLVAPDQDRLGVEDRAVVERHAALLADAEQRPDQVLPVAHPAGDAVQGDVDDLARHASPFDGVWLRCILRLLGKALSQD